MLLTLRQIIELITNTCKDYPFSTSRDQLRNEINIAVTEQIEQKNTKLKKKKARGTSLQARLACIDPDGLLAVLHSLPAKLRKFSVKETQDARKDPIKAAAQGRLILPKENSETVQALLVWVYQGRLDYQNADQLGIETLAVTCLTMLCNDTSRCLQQARSHKLPLQYLLGYGTPTKHNGRLPSVAIDNVVTIVFKHIT